MIRHIALAAATFSALSAHNASNSSTGTLVGRWGAFYRKGIMAILP